MIDIIVTVSGLFIKSDFVETITKITFYGKLKLFRFDRCIIEEHCLNVFLDFDCDFAVNNCDLTAKLGELILR